MSPNSATTVDYPVKNRRSLKHLSTTSTYNNSSATTDTTTTDVDYSIIDNEIIEYVCSDNGYEDSKSKEAELPIDREWERQFERDLRITHNNAARIKTKVAPIDLNLKFTIMKAKRKCKGKGKGGKK